MNNDSTDSLIRAGYFRFNPRHNIRLLRLKNRYKNRDAARQIRENSTVFPDSFTGKNKVAVVRNPVKTKALAIVENLSSTRSQAGIRKATSRENERGRNVQSFKDKDRLNSPVAAALIADKTI
ncbi:MAG: hypothetical protein PHQ23_05670, partial [Candidatus Wallbacteria bacterium]|nr:hypothetical protein [Candidatus Wallbacteria bacterium]